MEQRERVKMAQKERLPRIRKHFGKSTKAFADDIGVERTSLWKYETGERMIQAHALVNLWEKYGVTPGQVIGTEELNW